MINKLAAGGPVVGSTLVRMVIPVTAVPAGIIYVAV
jgi:hypothetical protein